MSVDMLGAQVDDNLVVARQKGRRVRLQDTRTLRMTKWVPISGLSLIAPKVIDFEKIRANAKRSSEAIVSIGEVAKEVAKNLEVISAYRAEQELELSMYVKADLALMMDERGLKRTSRTTKTEMVTAIIDYDEQEEVNA